MNTIFNDLLTFFGINTTPPETFSELIPWLFSVVVAIAIFMFIFSMIRSFVVSFGRGRYT